MTELSPEAKKLMRIAREAYSPADPRVASVRSALDARIALARGTGEGGAGGAGPAAAGALNLARLLGVSVLAVTIAGATMIGVRSASKTTPAGTAAPAVATPAATPIAAPAPVAHDGSSAAPAVQPAAVQDRVSVTAAVNDRRDMTAAPIEATRVAAATPHAALTPAPRVPHARRSAAAASLRSSARVDRAQTSAPLSFAQQVSDHEAPAQAVSSTARDEAPAAPEPSKLVDDSLAREVALLKRARAALDRNDARAALAITDEHAVQFASGVMRQERLATRVLALCALQRRGEALDAKHELERIAPRSPHLMRLRSSCAAETEAREVK